MPLSQSERRILKQATDYMRQKRYDEAIMICRKILDSNDAPEVHQRLGDLFERTNKINDAKEHFLMSAKLYEKLDMWNEALGIYRRLSRIMRGDEEELGFDKAQLYLKRNMIAEAIKELTSYGFKKIEQNNLSEAFKSFDKIVELEPMNMQIREKYSDLLEQKGQYQKAIENYEFMKKYFQKENDPKIVRNLEKKIEFVKSKMTTVISGKTKEYTEDERGDVGFMLGEFVSEDEAASKETADNEEIASAITQNFYDDFPVAEKEKEAVPNPYIEIKLEDSQLAALPTLSKIGGEESFSSLDTKEDSDKELKPSKDLELDISALKVDEGITLEDIFETKKKPVKEKGGKGLSESIAPAQMQNKHSEELFDLIEGDKNEYSEPPDLIAGLDLDELIKEMKDIKTTDTVFVGDNLQRIEVNEKVKKREDTVTMSSLDQSLSLDSLLEGSVDSWSDLAAELAKEMLDSKAIGELKETQNKMLTERSTWEEFEEQAELLLSVGEVEEAVDYLYQAADAYYDETQLDKSWSLYEKIVDLRPFELRPRQKMVQIALKLEDSGKAVKAYISLYDCQKLRGAFVDAEDTMKKLRRIAPDNPGVASRDVAKPAMNGHISESLNLSELLEHEHQKNKTPEEGIGSLIDEFKEEVYQSISSTERENFDAHYDLGITFKEMGLIEEAMEEFNIATKSKKSYVKSMEMIANCLIELEKKFAAVRQLEEVLSRNEFNENELVGIRYLLGNLYEENGEDEKAKHQFFQIMKVYPDFSDIKDRIKKYK
ncbi:hypothetical protein JW890_06255 [candidate division WOR-3 bacterium]|nr:hypothetical protein [candidate division WOR-3 bacterium]